ncbi:SAF domain-containing protein [Microbacterium sp. YY-03]|uniref:SAF domain-containing protein n=1 Tax=Microbacterium sp. YY-03 TaxID=3421636 RepID=UPI003D17B59B
MTAMSTRTHRAVWADARFLIGLVLVAASIAGVWWVVSAARATTPVAVADTTLLPGAPIDDDDVRWVDVALGEASGTYLTMLPDNATMTRPLAAGELIPAGAVIERERSEVTTVVITSPIDVASTLTIGSSVELWMSPVKDREYDNAEVLIESATVAAIRESSGLASGGTVTLELVVNRNHVAGVLDAQASKAALWVVPLGGVR